MGPAAPGMPGELVGTAPRRCLGARVARARTGATRRGTPFLFQKRKAFFPLKPPTGFLPAALGSRHPQRANGGPLWGACGGALHSLPVRKQMILITTTEPRPL